MDEHIESGHVKGGIVRAHLDWLRDKHGEAGVAQILQKLPPEIANEIRSVLATSWCSFRALVLFDRAIGDVFGAGNRDVLRDLGRFSARLNLSTTYRMFKRADIHDFFTRSATLHNQFQDFGAEFYEKTTEHAGRIVHRDYTSYSPIYCESAAGYYEEVMKIHGATRYSVEHPKCISRGAAECVFELKWM